MQDRPLIVDTEVSVDSCVAYIRAVANDIDVEEDSELEVRYALSLIQNLARDGGDRLAMEQETDC